jgi:hypothetical protein
MTILEQDKRPIVTIEELGRTEGYYIWTVGRNGITKIEPYGENGHMAPIPWLAIWKGEEITARVPADKFVIHY